MALTLVLGPANSAKAGAVLGAFEQAAQRRALLVVPTVADADHYVREVSGAGAVLGTVTTFSGLAGEIARRAGYGERRLSPLAREHVLRGVLARAGLELLGGPSSSRGFLGAAAALISELERSLVTPDRLRRALRRWAGGDAERDGYGSEVASLYDGYVAALRRVGRVDDELFAWRALDALRADPGRWGAAPVFFYGFDDLTRLQRDAVETLSRIAGTEVVVSLSYEPGRLAFAARAATVEELRPLADRVVELEPAADYYSRASRSALHHLERSLFEPGAERLDPGEAVTLLEAGGARAEAELVAAEVSDLLRRGVAADEVAVVCRSPAVSAPLLERVLEGYGIPVWSSRPVPLSHTALGHALVALARCVWLPNATAQDLLDVLRIPGRSADPAALDGLELELRRDGVLTASGAAGRLAGPVDELDDLRQARDRMAALGRQARRLFALPHRGRAPVLDGEEELDGRALAAVLAALGELAELGLRPSGPELVELLDQLELPAGTPRPGAVRIVDPFGIRAQRFRAVFVCGLQEGAFPLPASPEPFLSDERRREIALASGLALEQRDDALARERYLFYAAVSRASDRLVLSYRSSDEEGNLELPSPFLADVEEVLCEEWAQRRRRRLLADVVWDPARAPNARELALSLAAATAPPRGEPAQPERRLGERALQEVRHRRIVSAGALECYAECPVKWLVERELSPERFEPEPDPLARGSYMHEVLEELLRRLDGPVTPESLPAARGILEQLLVELAPPLAAGRPKPAQDGLAATIAADLRRYLEQEARDGCDWRPQALELRFGFDEEGSLPALALGVCEGEEGVCEGEEGVRVRGVIDRIDVDPSGRRAIVRDYKSGSARPEHQGARWQADGRLQVALYMLAVRQLLGLEPVAGLYQPLGGGSLRPRGVFVRDSGAGTALVANDGRDPDQFEGVLDDAASRAVALARRLREGELTPSAQTCSRDGCRYPGICRAG